VPLSFRWSPWEPGGSTHADRRASGAHRLGVTEIKKVVAFFRLGIIK
jgi:hypothetical protein